MRLSTPLTLFLFAGVCFVFTSCDIEHRTEPTKLSAQASADYSKTRETGDSKLEYDPFAGVNVIVWTDIYILETPVFSYSNSGESDFFPAKKKVESFVSLKTGLGYVAKGQKFKTGDTKTRFNYIELPVYGLYHYPLGESGSIYAGLGPYFAYGIGGKVKSQGFSENTFGENNGGYKKFDAGLGFKVGYEFNAGLYMDISYELGLANIAYASTDVKSHMRNASLNVGYNLANLIHKKK